MTEVPNTLKPIVADTLYTAAREIIKLVRQNTPYPFFLDGKLGGANIVPMSDTKIASAYDTPLSTIGDKIATILSTLAQADQQNGSPLGQIAQRANGVMANAGIINRHNRRPPLYVESTISAFIELGYAVPEHSPLIRAAGYVFPPPIDRRQLVLPVATTIFAGRDGVIIRYGGAVDYRPTNQAIEAETYGRQDTGNGSGQGWDERAFSAQVAEWAIAVGDETGASVAHPARSLRRGVGG